jgi:hypothetical protein
MFGWLLTSSQSLTDPRARARTCAVLSSSSSTASADVDAQISSRIFFERAVRCSISQRMAVLQSRRVLSSLAMFSSTYCREGGEWNGEKGLEGWWKEGKDVVEGGKKVSNRDRQKIDMYEKVDTKIDTEFNV